VVAIEGDSAFGFCGMEVACRYMLAITFNVLNNDAIGAGRSAPPGATEI
jgi:oxalyl-CoA decarboxylase